MIVDTRSCRSTEADELPRRDRAKRIGAALRRHAQALAIGLATLPAVALALRFALHGPGANPIEEITHDHGGGGYFSGIQSGDLVTPDAGIDIEPLNPQFGGVTQIQAVADLA